MYAERNLITLTSCEVGYARARRVDGGSSLASQTYFARARIIRARANTSGSRDCGGSTIPLPPILCSASVGGDVHPGLSVGISSPIATVSWPWWRAGCRPRGPQLSNNNITNFTVHYKVLMYVFFTIINFIIYYYVTILYASYDFLFLPLKKLLN